MTLVTITRANNRSVECLEFSNKSMLICEDGYPGFSPGFRGVNDLRQKESVFHCDYFLEIVRDVRPKAELEKTYPGQEFVRLFEVFEEHCDLSLVGAPLHIFSEVSVHTLHLAARL